MSDLDWTEAFVWELEYKARPWTTNKDRTMYHHTRAKLVKEWREAFKLLALEQKLPALKVFTVEVVPRLRDQRLQDTAACNPAAKAAIDGLIDAGVAPDDSNEWLLWIKFFPCEVTPGKDSLLVRVIGIPA